MNAAMVVYSHFSKDARVRRYAEALAKQNIKTDIFCLYESYKPSEKNINLFMHKIPKMRRARIRYIIEYLLFFIFSFFQFTIRHPFKKYRIVHVHNMPEVLVFSTAIAKLTRTLIVLDMHDPMPELYMSKYKTEYDNKIVKLLTLAEKLSFLFADKIITANRQFRKLFIKRHPEIKNKISIILNCPDPGIFNREQITDNKQQFTMLYMGTVEERFGLDIAIDAMPLLVKKIPKIKFIIIPKIEKEGKYFDLLKQKIIQLGLESHIVIDHPLSLEKVAEKIKTADVGVVLAESGVFTDLIFPVKLLEFVSMEIPVIATKTKTLSKNFGHDSIYFLEKNTSEEFAQAVLDIYKDKKLRQNLAQNAKKYLKINNWENEEKKYQQLLRILIPQA